MDQLKEVENEIKSIEWAILDRQMTIAHFTRNGEYLSKVKRLEDDIYSLGIKLMEARLKLAILT